MLNTLPQVSISVTLYWFSLTNKHIWRRKNNWNRYKRTPRRFVRRFDPLFLPEEQKWKRISNSYGFISWEISILEFSEIERRRLIPELLSQCLETKYIYLWIFISIKIIVMHKYLAWDSMYLLNCDTLHVLFILNKFQIVTFHCTFAEIACRPILFQLCSQIKYMIYTSIHTSMS